MRIMAFAFVPFLPIFIFAAFSQQETVARKVTRQIYGPFQLGNVPREKVTVEVQIVEPSESDIIGIVDIKDAQGTPLFHRDISARGAQIEVVADEASLPSGKKAVLLIESWIPTADTLGMYGQYFGFNSSGKFVRFSGKVFNNTGTPSFSIVEKSLNGKRSLLIEMREWTGYFFVIFHYPLNPDGCASDEASPISYENLPVRVMIDSKEAQENRKTYMEEHKGEESSIYLFNKPKSGNLSPRKVMLRPESTVDFIDATFTKTPKGERGDLWLKVRIDGQEGYVQQSPENFPKLGLMGAG